MVETCFLADMKKKPKDIEVSWPVGVKAVVDIDSLTTKEKKISITSAAESIEFKPLGIKLTARMKYDSESGLVMVGKAMLNNLTKGLSSFPGVPEKVAKMVDDTVDMNGVVKAYVNTGTKEYALV